MNWQLLRGPTRPSVGLSSRFGARRRPGSSSRRFSGERRTPRLGRPPSHRRSALSVGSVLLVVAMLSASAAVGQETETASPPSPPSPLGSDGNLVQFERDIAPIFRARCLKCHGPEDAKADLRIDDPELLIGYLEPGDAMASTLYVDYLTSEDDDMLMPPREHKGPLPPGELALIRIWIDEGAHWPPGYQLLGSDDDPETEESDLEAAGVIPPTFGGRVWKAIGYLHPATIHFPIALFMLGGLFVLLGIRWPVVGTQIPLACLLIGTATAIASAAMGWSLAPTAGYGASWELLSFEREVDAHRWSGVIVTVLAVVLSLIALAALWKDSKQLTGIWKGGLLACAMMVGLVGHQGGEMTYGRDFYPAMFRILRGEPALSPPSAMEADESPESDAAVELTNS